jgi:hypothetical protein
MRKLLKSRLTWFVTVFALWISTMVYQVRTAKVELTYPEKGITCITVVSFWGNKANAGCYTGDVNKPGNKINYEATAKYQRE